MADKEGYKRRMCVGGAKCGPEEEKDKAEVSTFQLPFEGRVHESGLPPSGYCFHLCERSVGE